MSLNVTSGTQGPRFPTLRFAITLVAFCLHTPSAAQNAAPAYFDLAQHLVQEFSGTYEFRHKQLEFTRVEPFTYAIKVTGDQSPRQDRLVVEAGYVYWILGNSGERWMKLRTPLRPGDEWRHELRGWNQQYRVVGTDLTISVPAGRFQNCAKVTISWVAREPDMEGPQQIDLYLAPHLGIIKRELWSNGKKWHEEVLIGYRPADGGAGTGQAGPDTHLGR